MFVYKNIYGIQFHPERSGKNGLNLLKKVLIIKMRIIPLLLHKDNDSFKGINYQNHIYLGDILNQIRILNDYEVDELVILNIKINLIKKRI